MAASRAMLPFRRSIERDDCVRAFVCIEYVECCMCTRFAFEERRRGGEEEERGGREKEEQLRV